MLAVEARLRGDGVSGQFAVRGLVKGDVPGSAPQPACRKVSRCADRGGRGPSAGSTARLRARSSRRQCALSARHRQADVSGS
jgi:hypothetical protein